MRATPHYPPPQPNTSARADYYNSYSPDRSSQSDPARADYRNDTERTSRRAGPPQSSAQRVHRSPQYSSPAPPPQQQRLYQQQQQRYTPDEAQPMDEDFKSVVYTVQDTYTDTHAHETEYGGVLTIRTTTVTRTVTERLVRSDEDEDSSDEDNGEEAVHQQ